MKNKENYKPRQNWKVSRVVKRDKETWVIIDHKGQTAGTLYGDKNTALKAIDDCPYFQ
jgi:hypothetical protein